MESSSALLEPTERSPRPSGRERHPHTATATEFCQALAVLNITQTRVARLFGVGPRSVRRWQYGDRRIPRGVGIVFHLLAVGTVKIEQIEAAALAISVTGTNDSGQPEPPASRLAKPAPEQSAPHADPDPTTAEKVFALASEACRWPCGDPRRSDFHFCGNPAVVGSYCTHHHGIAYLAAPPGATAARRLRVSTGRPAVSAASMPRSMPALMPRSM